MGTKNDMTIKNQFGETSICQVVSVSTIPLPAQAAGTIVANLTNASAKPTAVTKQALADAVPAKTGVAALTAIAVADAPAAAVVYTQADVQAMVDLINANKAALNALLAALKVVV